MPLAQADVERVAREELVYGGRGGEHPETVRRAVATLGDGAILRSTGRGRYAFEEPLLRQHILDPKGHGA